MRMSLPRWCLPWILLVCCACPQHETVTGPDGEALEEGECLLTVDVSPSCAECDGFERWQFEVTDAAAVVWTFELAADDVWIEVLPEGAFDVAYAAVLFGVPHPYGAITETCGYTYELSLGCAGFDFCD
jgi:hypothetical protein